MSENVIKDVCDIFENNWNRQVILYGPPGTSKTYSATIIAAKVLGFTEDNYDEAKKYLEEDDVKDRFKLVQFHPSYSYEDFVRGITVETKDGNLTYEVTPKVFEEICINAQEKKPLKFVLIIDEINRAPLASVLGELIYALEYRGNSIDTPYKKEEKEGSDSGYKITVPENLYIIGTMNTADRSIGSIDYAVRRRFAFVKVPSTSDGINDSWNHIGSNVEDLYKALIEDKNGIFNGNLLEDQELDIEDIKIGHTYFLGKNGDSGMPEDDEKKYMKYRLEYQVWPIYQEYIKDGLIKRDGNDRFKKILKKFSDFNFLSDNSYDNDNK